MRVKSHSLMLGYRDFDARIERVDGELRLVLDGIGVIRPSDYIKNGFTVKEASRAEIQALVEAGYETRRLLLRFYEL